MKLLVRKFCRFAVGSLLLIASIVTNTWAQPQLAPLPSPVPGAVPGQSAPLSPRSSPFSPTPSPVGTPPQLPNLEQLSSPEQEAQPPSEAEQPEKISVVEETAEPSAPEDLSPIEDLLAGRAPKPNASLRQFGYDLFARVPTTFAPVTDVPVGPDYVIGPGDSLNIVLWDGVQEAFQVTVDRNGAIALPRLGVVQVSGLTLDQLQIFLRQRFAEFFPSFQMAVTLGKLRTIQAFVVGEVRQPGTYTISSLSTMINALFASGGPTKSGTLRRIRLVRRGRTVHTLDLYNFLLQGDKSQDRVLQSGDTIFVPVIGAVAGVAGNVKRPAIYEFEAGTTLRRLLDLAGGVTPLGYLQRVQVERVIANEKKIVVDLDLSVARPAHADRLWQTRMADGDLVQLFTINTVLENVVTLVGHVARPGRYEWKSGMRLRDVLPSYNDLLPEPYTDYAEIVRFVEPDLRRAVVPFNVGALLAGDSTQNLLLRPQDTVRIFARSAFEDTPMVTVEGQVRRPGAYPLLAGMRVRDVVAQAGWVTKNAYVERAEIIRLTAARELISLPFNLGLALQENTHDNFLVQDEDRIIVHNLFEQKFSERVRISGLVNNPGAYALTKDMRVSDLLFRAGGVAKFAYLEKAEVTRHMIRQGGDLPIRIEIDLAKAIIGEPEHNLLLRDLDHLLVRQIPDLDQVNTVEILGEVRFSGAYPILKGERLSSVLRRAGGFTPEAYLRGVVLTRPSVQASQERRLRELIRTEEEALLAESAAETQTALTTQELQSRQQAFTFRRDLLARLRTVQPEGRLVIRLQRSLDIFADSAEDIEMESGDRLHIPQVPKYINVLGEVYNRVALAYEPNQSVADYLDKVGGLRKNALEQEIYLVRIDGTVISNSQSQFAVVSESGETMRFRDFFAVRPQPGDSIIVPRRVQEPATLRNFRDIIQIVFQSVGTIGVIAALL